MAAQNIDIGMAPPLPVTFSHTSTMQTNLLIDATGEKAALVGIVRKTGNIRRVQFRFGAVTKAGGSGLTVSLQDMLTSSGTSVPDETQDQTVAIANGDSSFASNTWYRTGTLSSDRAVTAGDRLAVVIEYDGSGRLGSDSVVINSTPSLHGSASVPGQRLKTGGSWTGQSGFPNVILEYDDGSFSGFVSSVVVNADPANFTFNTGSTPDERALRINLPVPFTAAGAWVWWYATSDTADAQLILYEETIAQRTITLDAHADNNALANVRDWSGAFSSPFACSANTNYYLALKPTTATNIGLRYISVDSEGHMGLWPMGTNAYLATRTDSGSWSTTTTQRPMMGLLVSALDDGAGGGGGGRVIGPSVLIG